MKKLIALFIVAFACGFWVSRAHAAVPELPSPGAMAPQFELADEAGKQVRLSDFKGKVVVLEWTNPDCPFVKRHYNLGTMKKLSESYQGKNVVWLAINSSKHASTEINSEWKKEQGFSYPILDDHAGIVGKQYGAKTTPHMFVVDANGILAYSGAIDSDPSGDGGEVTNYVAAALMQLTNKQSITQAQTKPYGCSVKYAS